MIVENSSQLADRSPRPIPEKFLSILQPYMVVNLFTTVVVKPVAFIGKHKLINFLKAKALVVRQSNMGIDYSLFGQCVT